MDQDQMFNLIGRLYADAVAAQNVIEMLKKNWFGNPVPIS